MADFNFNPPFGPAASTLTNRKGKISGRDIYWNYKKYAYIVLSSAPPQPETDSQSVLARIPTNAMTIGVVPTGGHLDLYKVESGVRRGIPHITSAKVSLDAGGDIYNSYIREFEIEFKVYTLSDLNNVEKNFFVPGKQAIVKYGWTSGDANETGLAETITIYNFGFSSNQDGSFDCNVKGLTGDPFAGSARLGGTIKLTDDAEIKALGEEGVNPADISMALICKYKAAFGLKPDENITEGDAKNGKIEEKEHGGDTFYQVGLMNAGESESIMPFMGDDPIRIPMISLETFIKYCNKLSGTDSSESFDYADEEYIKINNNTAEYGSADPRKYILPGNMSDYGEENKFKSVLGGKTVNIKNILISISEITKRIKSMGTTVDDKFQPPIVSKVIADIGRDLKFLTGGNVDLRLIPEDKDKPNGKYLLFNMQTVQATSNPEPFMFNVLGDDSIVKSVSIDTEFDMDTLLMYTVGNVKTGNVKLDPLKKVYTDIPDIPVEPSKTDEEGEESKPTKNSIGKDGIDDEKANSIALSMAQKLAKKGGTGSTFASVPIQIKLGVKIDGVENINFLGPCTVDRIPTRYKNAGVKFLVTGVEHSFDGEGGWETDIKTAMKLGD